MASTRFIEGADDSEGYLAETYHTPHGVLAAGEEVVGHRLAEYAHLGRALDVLLGEHRAVLYLELAYVEIVGCDAGDRRGVVVVAVDKLARRVDLRRYGRDAGEGLQGLVVGYLEGLHVVGALAHAAALHVAGMYHYHVRAHFGDLLADAVLGALSDGEHGYHRRHTYDDAEHGEETAQLVVVECLEGYLE